MVTCPNCGNQAGEGAIFCDQCGTRLPAPEAAPPQPAPVGGSVICPACGAANVPGEAFCDYCGSPLEAPVPATEAVPELEPVSAEAELAAETAPAAEQAPPESATAEAVPAEIKPICPVCGAEVLPGEAFCANCGASLAEAPLPPEPVGEDELEPPVVAAAPEPVPAPEVVVPAAEPVVPVPEAVPEPVVEPVMAETPPPAPAGPLTCPACGAEIEEGDTFCSSCGFALKAAEPQAAVEPPVPAAAPSAAGPRLVVVDSGAEIPVPGGDEVLIGREDPVSGIYPEIDLTPHGGEEGGVSRRHARLIQEGGAYLIEDLDSTNFTFVNKQRLAPGTRQPLADGDELRCGRVAMIFKQ